MQVISDGLDLEFAFESANSLFCKLCVQKQLLWAVSRNKAVLFLFGEVLGKEGMR